MIKQRTIKKAVVIKGTGLQTGRSVILNLTPSGANSGINFIRTDLVNKPLLNIQSLSQAAGGPLNLERRTVLGSGPIQIQTTEHLLSALSGLGIDNIAAELDGEELPGLDGSAIGFVEAIKKAGISEQDAPKRMLKIDTPVWVEGVDNFIAAFPADVFRVSYTMSYKSPALGTHFFDSEIDEKTFEKAIAPARTFCIKEEALILLTLGLGKGASYENTLVMGHNGPVKNRLRFSDEPVRHKVLDLIGDLYILGMPIIGHVVAIKSGHKLNMELVKRLKLLIK